MNDNLLLKEIYKVSGRHDLYNKKLMASLVVGIVGIELVKYHFNDYDSLGTLIISNATYGAAISEYILCITDLFKKIRSNKKIMNFVYELIEEGIIKKEDICNLLVHEDELNNVRIFLGDSGEITYEDNNYYYVDSENNIKKDITGCVINNLSKKNKNKTK